MRLARRVPPDHGSADSPCPCLDFHTTVRRNEFVTLSVSGELDLATSPLLIAAVNDLLLQREPQIVLDLGGLTFIDCSGLRTLSGLSHLRGVTLSNLSAPVRRLATLAGLAARFGLPGISPN